MSDKPVHPTPARYRVLEKAYIDGVLYAASTEDADVFVKYAGHPGTALEPTDEEGHQRKAEYFASRKKTADEALAEKRRLTMGAFDPGSGSPA